MTKISLAKRCPQAQIFTLKIEKVAGHFQVRLKI
jgi:hypothetical protein